MSISKTSSPISNMRLYTRLCEAQYIKKIILYYRVTDIKEYDDIKKDKYHSIFGEPAREVPNWSGRFKNKIPTE